LVQVGYLLRRREPNPENENCAVEVIYQIGSKDVKDKVRAGDWL
jgi:hypothetical protein